MSVTVMVPLSPLFKCWFIECRDEEWRHRKNSLRAVCECAVDEVHPQTAVRDGSSGGIRRRIRACLWRKRGEGERRVSADDVSTDGRE